MREKIKEIIDQFRSSIEGDGGSIDVQKIGDDGVIHLRQRENRMTNIGAIWTHRIRVERAIKAAFPDATIEVELQE